MPYNPWSTPRLQGLWLRPSEDRRSLWSRLTAPQLFVASFLSLILLGTLGLKVLPGLYTGEPLRWLDALFTATSAVCVTGLIVVDTATYFTTAGQGFLLLLIQLGGLGMITFTTIIILALGRRLTLRHERLAGASAEVASQVSTERLTRDVLLFTFGIEALGALVLYAMWAPQLGAKDAVWHAVFHAVSAFCNAGFSTFTTSLVGFQWESATLVAVSLILVIGGIGFLSMEELLLWWRAQRSNEAFRLSLHSRLVLVTTAVLLLAGWGLFALFEWEQTLAHLTPGRRFANALLLSATPRTAGFNSIDYANATNSTNFLTIILMFIGGSPGSTAGGLKTTTVALILLVGRERFRGREIPAVWSRSIPDETIQRAVGLSVVAFILVTASIFLFTWTERATAAAAPGSGETFLTYMFEAVSAFNTVGLSMGVTGGLSDPGRWLAIILMFVGRVGPLTFAASLAVAARRQDVTYRYAYEDVVVG